RPGCAARWRAERASGPRGLRRRGAARRAAPVQPDAGIRGGSHRPHPHVARGLRSARRGRLLAADGARGRKEPAAVPVDASESRRARAADRGLVAGGDALLRDGDARVRRAAAERSADGATLTADFARADAALRTHHRSVNFLLAIVAAAEYQVRSRTTHCLLSIRMGRREGLDAV